MFSLFEVFLFLRQILFIRFKFSDNNRQLYLISTLRHLPGKIFDLTPEITKFPISLSSLLNQKDNGAGPRLGPAGNWISTNHSFNCTDT